MTSKKTRYIRLRINLVGVVLLLSLLSIGVKTVHLQVFQHEWLSRQASNQYAKALVRVGKRGAILDRKGQKMAVSIEATSVAAYPAGIRNPQAIARALASALNVDRRQLQPKLTSKQGFVWLKRKATPKELNAVRCLDIDGIDFITEYSRFYPHKALAAQVLGFVGIDGKGLEGIEFQYDDLLSGTSNQRLVLKDARGRNIIKAGDPSGHLLAPRTTGHTVVLSIDHAIQYITENALKQTVAEFKAQSGIAVVMDPQTGAVLAMANVPLFNPNVFTQYPKAFWRNRAVTDPFEPGSTMKIFTAAAALTSGDCSPNTIFFCENGVYRIGRNTIHDTHPRGWLSLQQIVKYSSNIGAAKVIETIGAENLHHTIARFGFGSKSAIDCPGETAGRVAPVSKWTRIDTGAISFGQGISVSPIQLAAATAAIANGGRLMRPHTVQAVVDSLGNSVSRTEPLCVRQAVSRQTAETIKRIMKTVITDGGTGMNAAIAGYSVAGKTGTAQKIDATGTYAQDKFISSFVGFAPVDDPRIVVLVIVDEPQTAHYGGTVAAPAFRQIALETLIYLGIPPDLPSNDLRVSLVKEVHG